MPTEKVPTLSKLAYDKAKAIMASNKEKKIDTVIKLLKVNTKISKIVEHDGKSSSVTADNDRRTRFNEGVSETIGCIDAQNKDKSIAVTNGNGCQKLKKRVDVDDGDENEHVNNKRGDCGESFSGETEIEHKYQFEHDLCVESVPESDKDDDDDDEQFYVVGEKISVDEMKLEKDMISGEEDEIHTYMYACGDNNMCGIQNVGDKVFLVVQSENEIDEKQDKTDSQISEVLDTQIETCLDIGNNSSEDIIRDTDVKGNGEIKNRSHERMNRNDGMEIDALSLLGFTDEQNDSSDEDEVLFTAEELIGEETVRAGVKRKRTEECYKNKRIRECLDLNRHGLEKKKGEKGKCSIIVYNCVGCG